MDTIFTIYRTWDCQLKLKFLTLNIDLGSLPYIMTHPLVLINIPVKYEVWNYNRSPYDERTQSITDGQRDRLITLGRPTNSLGHNYSLKPSWNISFVITVLNFWSDVLFASDKVLSFLSVFDVLKSSVQFRNHIWMLEESWACFNWMFSTLLLIIKVMWCYIAMFVFNSSIQPGCCMKFVGKLLVF